VALGTIRFALVKQNCPANNVAFFTGIRDERVWILGFENIA
jgi:hypothetical protein